MQTIESAGPTAMALRDQPAEFNLPGRYAVASLPVIVSLMLFLGWWVNRAIEKQVIDNTAANVALYVQSFLSPELQGLADRDFLTPAEMQRIETLLEETPLGQRIRSVKVWKQGGLVVYYSRRALIGQRFEPTENLKLAWQGMVAGEFDELRDQEDSEEAKLGLALLEIYSPVREHGKERIVAVAEFYQDARELADRLGRTRSKTWLVVIVSTLLAYGLLYGIVLGGGRVILRQRRALRAQVDQLSTLLADNQVLGDRLTLAVRRTTELNERLLRRVSADLHDGPAQSLSLALLRLDALPAAIAAERRDETRQLVDELRGALQESLTELRHISRGLGLPDLEGLTLLDTIDRAIAAHSRRTRTAVARELDANSLSRPASMPVKLTAYRAVQETLMNAYRHADAKDQKVRAEVDDVQLKLEVSDRGPGFPCDAVLERTDRLGLQGLRERIESLGGGFSIVSGPDDGTTVSMTLPIRNTT
jgi:signal transduction histidine kinase